jgi:XTP/dITP diphosphohydrolase
LYKPFLAIKKVNLSFIGFCKLEARTQRERKHTYQRARFCIILKQMSKNNLQILMATKNGGKITELKKLLACLPIQLLSLRDFPDVAEVRETGGTFAANAALKAQGYARQTGIISLADDSGLEVVALGGAPGVFSARYAGENASDAARIKKLLREISRTGNENRSARFVCAMAIADKNGVIIYAAEEFCEGAIASATRGSNGFGYDAVFIPTGFNKTFGELSDAIKQKISHRARASIKIIRYLRDFIAV